MEAFLEKAVEIGTSLGIKLLCAALVLIVGLKLAKFLVKIFVGGPAFKKVDEGAKSFIKSFLTIVLDAAVIISAAYILGIPVTSFLTILASAGVAIGLALQGALSNFAGGLMILIFKPFSAGDYIETASCSGTVCEITVIYTIILTPDNKRITLPNGTLTNSAVTNYSHEATRRVDMDFCVGYTSDIEKVKGILLAVARENKLSLQDPEPFAGLVNQGDSSLEFTLRVWCKTEDYWTLKFELNEAVKNEFDKNSIEIPFPQLDVHLAK